MNNFNHTLQLAKSNAQSTFYLMCANMLVFVASILIVIGIGQSLMSVTWIGTIAWLGVVVYAVVVGNILGLKLFKLSENSVGNGVGS